MAGAPDPPGQPPLERVASGGPGRRGLIALAIICLLIGLAVAEPWAEPADTTSEVPAPSVTPRRPAASATAPAMSAPTVVDPGPRSPGPPGAPSSSPALVEAVELARAVAGRWALVAQPGGVPADQRPDSAPTDTGLLGRDCAGGELVAPPRVLVAGYRGRQPTEVTIERLFSDGSRAALPARIVVDAVPGAILAAPVRDSVWRAGYYAVRMTQPARRRRDKSNTLVFCVGEYEPPGYVLVPIGVDERDEFTAP